MVTVNTRFTPFRLKLGRREPVQLNIELANRDDEAKIVTLMVDLGRALSFDKGGLKRDKTIKIDNLEKGERENFYFDVYAKQIADLGEHPVRVKVWEHFADKKDYVRKEFVKNMTLQIER